MILSFCCFTFSSQKIDPKIKREEWKRKFYEFDRQCTFLPLIPLASEVGPAEDELGAAGGAGVVMDAGAMLAIAT